MIPQYKHQAIAGIVGAICCSVCAPCAPCAPWTASRFNHAETIDLALRCLASALFIWCCWMYSNAKALPAFNWAWGFCGLVGLIVLFMKKDQSKPADENIQRGFEVLPVSKDSVKYSQFSETTLASGHRTE